MLARDWGVGDLPHDPVVGQLAYFRPTATRNGTQLTISSPVTNISTQDATVVFGSPVIVKVSVLDDAGSVVWAYLPSGSRVEQTLTYLTLAPGETKTFTTTWNGADSTKHYTVQVDFLGRNSPETAVVDVPPSLTTLSDGRQVLSPSYGGLNWTAFTNGQGSTSYYARSADESAYYYFGPDNVLYKDPYLGEVHPGDLGNAVGDVRTYFPSYGGLKWEPESNADGSSGYGASDTRGGYYFYGADARLYDLAARGIGPTSRDYVLGDVATSFPTYGGLEWSPFETNQSSTGYSASDGAGQYYYYGPDGVVYRDSYPGEVRGGDLGNAVGTVHSVFGT